jgi:hypothetical protein
MHALIFIIGAEVRFKNGFQGEMKNIKTDYNNKEVPAVVLWTRINTLAFLQ